MVTPRQLHLSAMAEPSSGLATGGWIQYIACMLQRIRHSLYKQRGNAHHQAANSSSLPALARDTFRPHDHGSHSSSAHDTAACKVTFHPYVHNTVPTPEWRKISTDAAWRDLTAYVAGVAQNQNGDIINSRCAAVFAGTSLQAEAQIDLPEDDEMHSDGALLDAEEVEFENLSGEADGSVLSETLSQDNSGEEIDPSRTAGGGDEDVAEQSVGELEYEEDQDRLSELSSGELDDLEITRNSPGSSIGQAQRSQETQQWRRSVVCSGGLMTVLRSSSRPGNGQRTYDSAGFVARVGRHGMLGYEILAIYHRLVPGLQLVMTPHFLKKGNLLVVDKFMRELITIHRATCIQILDCNYLKENVGCI
ncbi:hypothetical protein CRG98_044198 [Punica granatum]|uniref:Uncharacterized protein n=1 Tax=Punica granatum TaxID=22663 RepID=A0A2I0HUM2_PUNGR|nr:hypothetical protein CRG98_044198 [Punica granatum]